jgi:predicted nucleotidyltransferase
MEANFRELLPVLVSHGVRFIVVGGGAAIAHGIARLTYDVAVVYARDLGNIQAGLNFTLTTDLGDLDLLGEVTGGGTYEELLPYTEELTAFNVRCRFVTIERLIQLKRAAGRPKDFEVIAELQALLEERRRSGT